MSASSMIKASMAESSSMSASVGASSNDNSLRVLSKEELPFISNGTSMTTASIKREPEVAVSRVNRKGGNSVVFLYEIRSDNSSAKSSTIC